VEVEEADGDKEDNEKAILVFLGIIVFIILGYFGYSRYGLKESELVKKPKERFKKEVKMEKKEMVIEQSQVELTLVTVYDNYQFDPMLKTGLGFSCLAKFKDKNILFDTGADSPTLISNMEKLGIDPKEVDLVVLSHIHGDHVDGLWGFLERNGKVEVYIPASFPDSFRERVKSYGANYRS
jgi:7,8-dihydropterin-6-yl-methyl-4-(beta-D-ribofuranosyl)aminobenzene 5'-phosphate synthase